MLPQEVMRREPNPLPVWIRLSARKLRIDNTEVGAITLTLEKEGWLPLLALVKRVSSLSACPERIRHMAKLLQPSAETNIVGTKESEVGNKPPTDLKPQATVYVLIQCERTQWRGVLMRRGSQALMPNADSW